MSLCCSASERRHLQQNNPHWSSPTSAGSYTVRVFLPLVRFSTCIPTLPRRRQARLLKPEQTDVMLQW